MEPMDTKNRPPGRPVADDAPAFLAPAIDVRRVVALVETGSLEDVEQATAMALSFPIPSRPWRDARPGANAETEGAVPDARSTLAGSPYKQGALGDETVRQSPRDILARSLLSIGPLAHVVDAAGERPATDRVLVGRARAIRFRLALEDAWPEQGELRARKAPIDPRLSIALDTAVVVAIADGMPAGDDGASPHDLPMVQLLLREVRARFPEVTRAALKDAAVTAFARCTLLGFERALTYVKTEATAQAPADRLACFETAKRLSLVPALDEHRVRAIAGLRQALAI